MQDNQLVKYNFNQLDAFCGTHSKRPRYKNVNMDVFKQTVFNMAAVLQDQYNCSPLFLTVTFPFNKNNRQLQKEWESAALFIEGFKKRISQDHLVVGGVIAVEPHKNTSLKTRKGKDRKAGAPHFHMVLWVTHKFINPGKEQLSQLLLQAGTYSKIDYLESHLDTLKAVLYATKEKGDDTITHLSQTFFKWENGINIWINHDDTQSTFETIGKGMCFQKHSCFNTYEKLVDFPTTKRYNDHALLLAHIFSKVFARQGLAVKDGNVFSRIQGTRFSWQEWIDLDQWVAQRFSLDHPAPYMQMLKQNAEWIHNQGKVKKNHISFDLFPKISPINFLVEFKDSLYDFSKGCLLDFQSVSPQTATVCFVGDNFDDCEPPFTFLGILHVLIAYGVDITPQRKDLSNKPETLYTNADTAALQRFQKCDNLFKDALKTFGGLFHPMLNRKRNPALYLYGPSSTYKTFLIRTIFSKLVGLDSVEFIDRNHSRFNTANLRKNDDTPYVLIIDDLRWDHLGMHLPGFINLLDGYFVKTEGKYEKAKTGPLKGTIDEPIATSNVSVVDKEALKRRLKQVQLFSMKGAEDFTFSKEFLDQIEKEAVGFSILANAFFLQQAQISQNSLRLPKSFLITNTTSLPQPNLFQTAGIEHMKHILALFDHSVFV